MIFPYNHLIMNTSKLSILLVFCSILHIQAQQASIKVKFQINKIHYLVSVVEAASGDKFGSKHLRRVYEASPYNTTANRKVLDRFQQLMLDFVDFKYPGYPSDHITSTNIWDLFKNASVQSASLQDLKQRTAGMYPTEVHTVIFEVLQHMQPVFEQLFWQPNIKQARAFVKDLDTYMQQHQTVANFQKIATFYGSRWNSDLPFIVSFLPLPAHYKRGSSAHFKGNMLTCDLPLATQNKASFISIIFHELSHILYEQQPIVLQKQIEDWFLNNSLKSRQFAYQWINEALATACGNAWLYYQLTDSLEQGSWYGNRYIDQFARQLYPKVSQYIAQNKSIDQAFVQYSIRTFAQTFPDALYDYDQWMLSISVLHNLNTQELDKSQTPLYKNFRVQKNYSLDGGISPATIKQLAQSYNTQVIILVRQHKQALTVLQKNLPTLRNYRLDATQDFVLTYLNPRGIPVILINIHDLKNWEKALKAIRKQKTYRLTQAAIKL